MEQVIFALPGNELLAESINKSLHAAFGELVIRHFPDGESYIRVLSDVQGKEVILVCTLHHPNDKILPLYFLSKDLRDLGAKKITLVAPYLAYMRQDKKFQPGEGLTNAHFAQLISGFADTLITIDPHLHRLHSMSEIYTIPCQVLHVAHLVADYIRTQILHPVLIGPDSESEQWVAEIARQAHAPFLVLEKDRLGDKEVKIISPALDNYLEFTPVLVDDIISTAHTMMEAILLLQNAGMHSPVCVGVHAVFAGHAFEELEHAGAKDIVTCNTIWHPSNKIDVSETIISALLPA